MPTASAPQQSKLGPNSFSAIAEGRFLHDRPKSETFKLLVDALRMRQEDAHNLTGDNMPGTIYNGETSSEKAFKAMLRKAEAVPGLLPNWWTKESTTECLNDFGGELRLAQEKHDIQVSWEDPLMPMKLRMIGERIWGNTPGVQSPTAGMTMLMMQVAAEARGTGSFTTMNMAAS